MTMDNDTMNVYDIAPDNSGRVHVYIIVPGVDTLIGLPLDKALAFAGDLAAESGRYELLPKKREITNVLSFPKDGKQLVEGVVRK